jgi:hypothetical protein
MPVWALQVITIVSACGGMAATVTAAVLRVKLHNERWNHDQTRKAGEHAESFHRCPVHRDTGLYNAPDPHQRVDLTDISTRNRDRYMNRSD